MKKIIVLLDCPFCGSKAKIKERDILADDPPPYYDVCCTYKGCHLDDGFGYHFETREDAAKNWNENIKLIK